MGHFRLKWNSVKRVLLCIVLALGALTVFALWEGSGSVRAQEITSGETTLLADAPTSGTCGENLTWNFDVDTGVLTISGTGVMYNYYDVPWHSYDASVKSLVLEKGMTSIGDYAFQYCSSLTDVTIPDSVTSIGNLAFDGCSSLTSVTIPDSVTSIGGYAFQDCSSLTQVTIPDSVTSIGYRAFSSCDSLTSVTIPNSVTFIESYVFSGCDSLAGVTIPNSVTSIGQYAFSDCRSLASVDIPDSVTSIGNSTFSGCSSLASVTIPDSVTSIGGAVFKDCSNLANVTIPDSVTSIGVAAFWDCSSLTSVTIPASVTSIGDSAFWGCSSLTSVIIPDSVTSIGDHAFDGCSSLASVAIPNSVTSIGNLAFGGCSSLTSVIIPDSVTAIEWSAFEGCSSLTSVAIPSSVTFIDMYAFNGCNSLSDVYYAGSAEAWAQIEIGSVNSDLTNATIHYYSTGSGSLPANVCSMIGVLEEYDAQSREIFLFDREHDIYHYPVTDSTDLSFLDQLDSMIGKPVLLRYIPGEYGVETLTRYVWSIEPVTPRLGTLESLGDNVLILDGRIYFHGLNDPDGLEWCVENEVVCYLDSQDTVLSLTMLRKSSGTLDSGTASSATIDSLSHPVFCEGVPPYLPAPELWFGREVTYWSADEIIFRLELPAYTDTYHRRLDRLEDRTAYFHDGSQYVLADEMNADESLVGHWVKLVLETSSNGAQLVEMELLKPRVTVDIALDNGGAIQFNGRKFSFGDDNYESSSQFKIAFTITIQNTPVHDSEEDLALMMRDSSLNLTLEELRIGTSDGFNTGSFGGGKPPKVDGTVLSAGETYTTGGYIRPSGVSYFRNRQRMTETISARLQSSAENGDALGSTSFTVTNLDYQAETSAEIKDLSQEAANELANMDIDQVIVLSAFDLLYNDFGLSTKDVKALQQHILTTLSLCAMPEDTIQEEITQSVLDKLKASFALSSKRQTVTLHYQFETEKYGVLYMDLICKLSNFILNDSEFALTGDLSYQITNPPAALRHKQEGKFGAINQYDIKAFADAAYALAEKEIKAGIYDKSVGNAANQVADMIFSETTKAILSRLGYKPSELLWKLMTWPTKSYRIACPVDVFVYDSDGNRCGAIVGGMIVKDPDASFDLQEEGDVKYILNLEDGYQVQCVAYSFGTMDVDISEGGGYEQPVRLISFQDVSLVPQEKFTQNAPDGIGEDISQYTLASSSYDGTSVRPADLEQLLVHLAADYVPPEIEPSFEFSLKTHTSTSAEVEISNTAEEDINASFVVSAYNSEGKMIACQVIQKELDTLESLSLSVSWGQDDEIAVVRGFAVDVNTKAPLCGQWEQAIS